MFHSIERSSPLRWAGIGVLGSLPIVALSLLVAFLSWKALSLFGSVSLGNFAGASWSPLKGDYGVVPLLLGTLATTGLALAIAVPLGLLVSLHLGLEASFRFRRTADMFIGVLGAVPSIVIGLWGMRWIAPMFGNSLLSASIVLAIMIIPTFVLLAGAAIRQVPEDVPEVARSIGGNDFVVARVVLRQAWPGVVGAIVLATCRALGEAVAISMVAGNVAKLPTLFGSVATLATTIVVEFEGAAGVHYEVLYVLAFLLVWLLGLLALVGRRQLRVN